MRLFCLKEIKVSLQETTIFASGFCKAMNYCMFTNVESYLQQNGTWIAPKYSLPSYVKYLLHLIIIVSFSFDHYYCFCHSYIVTQYNKYLMSPDQRTALVNMLCFKEFIICSMKVYNFSSYQGLIVEHGPNISIHNWGIYILNWYTCSFLFPLISQSDLGNISAEIQSLQDQSKSMSIKLQNRQVSCHHIHNYS